MSQVISIENYPCDRYLCHAGHTPPTPMDRMDSHNGVETDVEEEEEEEDDDDVLLVSNGQNDNDSEEEDHDHEQPCRPHPKDESSFQHLLLSVAASSVPDSWSSSRRYHRIQQPLVDMISSSRFLRSCSATTTTNTSTSWHHGT
jgi:hypothetical protein